MEGDWDERDQVGSSGLPVWKDPRNFLRLEKFRMDELHYGSVGLEAMIQGEMRSVGRGLLAAVRSTSASSGKGNGLPPWAAPTASAG